jgi:hypothetical protein
MKEYKNKSDLFFLMVFTKNLQNINNFVTTGFHTEIEKTRKRFL